jgi:hypothetical protein
MNERSKIKSIFQSRTEKRWDADFTGSTASIRRIGRKVLEGEEITVDVD